MTKLNVLCFIESDPEIRNFLHSGMLDELFDKHRVKLVLPPANYKRIKSDVEALDLRVPISRITIPQKRLTIWRKLYHLDQMRLRLDLAWFRIWLSWWGIVGWKAGVLFCLANLPGIRSLVRWKWKRELDCSKCHELDALVEEAQPDIIIHPSTFGGYFVNDFVDAGKRFGIPTFLVMNSWDNPSTKRALSGKPDRVGVWGTQTQKHTEKYLGMPSEDIVVLGSAQFEVYRQKPRITPEQFRAEHGLHCEDKVLLYAGSSRGTQEAMHLEWLNRAIDAGELPKIKILYRPHPWGIPQSQAKKILKSGWQNVVIENSMRDFVERVAEFGSSGAFYMAEYARTHDVLSSVDMALSPLSTIIIEGALHGKPVMCFYPREEEKGSIWRKNIKKLPHFEDIFKSETVVTCLSYSDLIPSVQELIDKNDTPSFERDIIDFSKYFVSFPEKSYALNLVDQVEDIVKNSIK
jgi:hypothetical protein